MCFKKYQWYSRILGEFFLYSTRLKARGIKKKYRYNCSNIHRYFIKTHGITCKYRIQQFCRVTKGRRNMILFEIGVCFCRGGTKHARFFYKPKNFTNTNIHKDKKKSTAHIARINSSIDIMLYTSFTNIHKIVYWEGKCIFESKNTQQSLTMLKWKSPIGLFLQIKKTFWEKH